MHVYKAEQCAAKHLKGGQKVRGRIQIITARQLKINYSAARGQIDSKVAGKGVTGKHRKLLTPVSKYTSH